MSLTTGIIPENDRARMPTALAWSSMWTSAADGTPERSAAARPPASMQSTTIASGSTSSIAAATSSAISAPDSRPTKVGSCSSIDCPAIHSGVRASAWNANPRGSTGERTSADR